MVQESDLVPRNGLGHVLEIHHKQNSVNDHKYAGYLNHCESSLYNLINLSATIQIKASKRLFLILHQNVLVILPDSRNVDLLAWASEVLHVVAIRKVLSGAPMVHQLLLAKLREHKDAFSFAINWWSAIFILWLRTIKYFSNILWCKRGDNAKDDTAKNADNAQKAINWKHHVDLVIACSEAEKRDNYEKYCDGKESVVEVPWHLVLDDHTGVNAIKINWHLNHHVKS